MRYMVGEIVEGVITGIKPYGAFVYLDSQHNGLIHISEISERFVRDVHTYVKINQRVRVKILDVEYSEELEYKIVGSTEANSLKGKISNESPVGKALIGHKVGDTVEVETPAGVFAYKILEIQRSNVD